VTRPPVKVEYNSKRLREEMPALPAGYVSKPGDARRQGRAVAAGDRRPGAAQISVTYVETGATIEARLGVICIAQITINPNGGYLWSCFLPMLRPGPQPAADLDKALAAVDYKVREWCEAARLISARAKGGDLC
jgi:hypothetical protein